MTIRLAICEDHRLLAEALAMVVEQDDDLALVAPPVDSADAIVDLVERERPQVVLMDVNLRGAGTGIDATRRIAQAAPDTQVLIVSGLGQEQVLVEAVEAGAVGFIEKTEAVETAIAAVKAAAAGEPLLDPVLLSRLLQRAAEQREARRGSLLLAEQLTPREREILQLVAEGLRNEDVAKRLHLSVRTVQTHVQNVLGKLGVHSRLEAVAFGVRLGVVTIGGPTA